MRIASWMHRSHQLLRGLPERQPAQFVTFLFEITSGRISLQLWPLADDTCNSVIGYKNGCGFFPFILPQVNCFAFIVEKKVTNAVNTGRSSTSRATISGVKCMVKNKNSIKQTKEEKKNKPCL